MRIKENYFQYIDNFSKYKTINSILLYGEEKKEKKMITIAIPTYKRVNLLKEALESAINQENYNEYEIIVVDNDSDFSNVECLELIKALNCKKIKYYKNEKNIGMFGNWNRCIELAQGEYITILNDDDWLERNYLFEITKVTEEQKAIYNEFTIIDLRKEKKMINKEENYKKILKKLYKKMYELKKIRTYTVKDFFYGNRSAGSLGILFHRKSLKSLGGYNPDYFPSSDYFYHTNYIYKFGGLKLKKKLCNYRIFENESMKPETAKKWPIIDSKFREYLDKNILKINNLELLYFLKNIQKLNLNKNWEIGEKVNNDKIKLKYKIFIFIREKLLDIFG